MSGHVPRQLSNLQTGPGMALLAILCWYLTVAQEMSKIFCFFMAVLWVPRGQTYVQSEQGRLEIKSISHVRLLMCMLMVLVRLTICGFLLYAGTLYLVGTIDMRDLLLNSMALGVVLEVDELVFAALAPDSAREAIECAAPLPYSIIPRFHGLDVKAFLFTCLLLGGAPVFIIRD